MLWLMTPVAAVPGFAIMSRVACPARPVGLLRSHGCVHACGSVTAPRTTERLVMLGAGRDSRTGTRKDRHAVKTARSERWIS